MSGIRKKEAFVENVEKKLESYVGLEKYIKLRLLELFNPDEYSYELQIIYEKLEDPCNLINYIQNIEYYSAVYLLLTKKAIEEKIELVECEITMPLFNFENLLKENDKNLQHVFNVVNPFSPAGDQANTEIADFFKARMTTKAK